MKYKVVVRGQPNKKSSVSLRCLAALTAEAKSYPTCHPNIHATR